MLSAHLTNANSLLTDANPLAENQKGATETVTPLFLSNLLYCLFYTDGGGGGGPTGGGGGGAGPPFFLVKR